MAEPKPIASLSGNLLARKGHAKPAMRPQGFTNFNFGAQQAIDDLGWNDMGTDPVPAAAPPVSRANLQGGEVVPIVPDVAPVAAQVEPPVVHRQQEEIAREMAAPVAPSLPEPEPAPEPEQSERRRDDRARDAVSTEVDRIVLTRAAAGSKSKAAFTLRLDPARHLKLRLAGAVAHRSSQAIVVDALDAYLNTQTRVIELARETAERSDAALSNESGNER